MITAFMIITIYLIFVLSVSEILFNTINSSNNNRDEDERDE